MKEEKRINIGSKIWDLHIHTSACPKGSNEFHGMEDEEFVRRLIEVFNNYSDLELFSFTDHNQISIEVYQEYMRQNGPIPFVVGAEIDVLLTDQSPKAKHLIVYFDIDMDSFSDCIIYMKTINDYVNGKLKDNKKGIPISELLGFLVEKKKKFILSPHAFKQNERAINSEWMDDEGNAKATKYMGQFFCFWEAAGLTEIERAKEFLNYIEKTDDIQMVAFSDSNNFNKMIKYLDKPHQYFRSLPSFRGVELVGTDDDRIVGKKQGIDQSNLGNVLSRIEFNGQVIQLSNCLNAIIGGRGAGKSILLDTLAYQLDQDKSKDGMDKDRVRFICSKEKKKQRFTVNAYDASGEVIQPNVFKFDYYSQSYVSKIFTDKEYDKKLEAYFSDAFSVIEPFNVEGIKRENKLKFETTYRSLFSEQMPQKQGENISRMSQAFSVISDVKYPLALKEKSIKEKLGYKDVLDKLEKAIITAIPETIRNDVEVKRLSLELKKAVIIASYQYNTEIIRNVIMPNELFDEYKKYKNGISKRNKKKEEIKEQFLGRFNASIESTRKRVAIVNAYIQFDNTFDVPKPKEMIRDGANKEAFKFERSLKIERPLAFMKRKFIEFFPKAVSDDFEEAIRHYCYEANPQLLRDKTIEELDQALLEFGLSYDNTVCVYYFENGEYTDIKKLSPGTQTNILMEYLVYKDTTRPLLIDQPEDNVDNYTIYNSLTKWFKTMKKKRQVIVVTHDANIVINADAENVIIANQSKPGKFTYEYGALEYGNLIDEASKILDGGKDAVKKRMRKYGD